MICLKYHWSLITSFCLGPCLQWHAYLSSQQDYSYPDIYTCRDREMNISSIQCVVVIKLFQIKHKMGMCWMVSALKSSHILQICSQIWQCKRVTFISDSDHGQRSLHQQYICPNRSEHSRWVSRVQPCEVQETISKIWFYVIIQVMVTE